MATKTIITNATFTLVNGTDIAFSDAEAVKAVGQYDHYQNIHATDDNSNEVRFPITAIASVSVTTDTETVDMTDNFCKAPAPPQDYLFLFPVGDEEIPVTEDMIECESGEWNGNPYANALVIIPNTNLIVGQKYSIEWKGETYLGTVSDDGQLQFGTEYWTFSNREDDSEYGWHIEGWLGDYGDGETCDSVVPGLIADLTANPITFTLCDPLFEMTLFENPSEMVKPFAITDCDFMECSSGDNGQVVKYVIIDTRLLTSQPYIATWGNQTDTQSVDEGTVSFFNGAIFAQNSSIYDEGLGYNYDTVEIWFYTEESTCEGAKAWLENALTQNTLEILYCDQLPSAGISYGTGDSDYLVLTECDLKCVSDGGGHPTYHIEIDTPTANWTVGAPGYDYSYWDDENEQTVTGTVFMSGEGVMNIPNNSTPVITIYNDSPKHMKITESGTCDWVTQNAKDFIGSFNIYPHS